jgi:hypothetical protein
MNEKRQIRWLQTYRQFTPCATPSWKSVTEVPEVIRNGNFVIFQKGRELSVFVRASARATISVPGIGELVGATKGTHFEFIGGATGCGDSDDDCADCKDELCDDVKLTDEQVRRILMCVVMDDLVSFLSGQREDTKTICHRLEWLRDQVTWPSKPIGSSVQSYLTSFLQHACFDVAALTLLLQHVCGFTADEAGVSAPILADRCGFSSK